MSYKQWWEQFASEHDEWRYADSEALRKAAFEAGQESMRQQLAELLDWQQKAFAAHPNIDIDIDRLKGGN